MQHRVAVHGRVGQRRQVQRRGDVFRQGQPQTLQHRQFHCIQRAEVGDDALESLLHLQHVLMPVAVVVAPVVSAVAVMPMLPVAVVGVTMIMDAFVVAIAVGVVGVQFSRVSVCSHDNRVRKRVEAASDEIS